MVFLYPTCKKWLESTSQFNKNLVGAIKAMLVKDAVCGKGVEKSFEIFCPSFVSEVRWTPYSNFISVKNFSGDKLFPWKTVTWENWSCLYPLCSITPPKDYAWNENWVEFLHNLIFLKWLIRLPFFLCQK